MKNVFGINVANGYDSPFDGQVFHSDSAVNALGDIYEKYIKIMNDVEKKTSLSLVMKTVKYFSFTLASAIYVLDGRTPKAYTPILSGIMVLSYFTFFFLIILEWKKKRYKKSEEYNRSKRYMRKVDDYTKTLLKIPESAKVIDILILYYKIKNGKMKIVDIGVTSYQNYEVSIYADKNNFYIANFCQKWAIPLHCITGIKKINKRICISSWNKEVPYDKGKYKKYKMKMDYTKGQILCKPYYALCIKWRGENYEMFIPSYDFDVLAAVIGIKYSAKL